MEKRAVVTKYLTPDLKDVEKEKNVLKKSAESFNSFMDKLMSEPTSLSIKASEEDEKTFENERKDK